MNEHNPFISQNEQIYLPPSYSASIVRKCPPPSPSSENASPTGPPLKFLKNQKGKVLVPDSQPTNSSSPSTPEPQDSQGSQTSNKVPDNLDPNEEMDISGSEANTPNKEAGNQPNPPIPNETHTDPPPSNQLQKAEAVQPKKIDINTLIQKTITAEITNELLLPLNTEFPIQEGITETNITEANQITLWNEIKGPRIYCFLPYVNATQDTAELGRRNDLIYDFFLKLHLEEIVSINPPVKAPTISSHRLAYPFLIGEVPEDYATVLTHVRCWVLKEAILFFFPENFTPSPYAVTLKGLLITDKGPNDTVLASRIRESLTHTHRLSLLLTLHNTKPNGEVDEAALQEIVQSVRVSRIRADIGKEIPQTLLHVYITPPTNDTKKYEAWIKAISEHKFVISAGQGTKDRDLICELCKARDHIIDMCQFESIANWPTDHPQKHVYDQTIKAIQTNRTNRERSLGKITEEGITIEGKRHSEVKHRIDLDRNQTPSIYTT